MLNRVQFEAEARKRVIGAFDKAEDFVEGLRHVLHGKVNDLRGPVVTFVSSTVDSALEIRERAENLAASIEKDAKAMRKQAQGWIKKFQRA